MLSQEQISAIRERARQPAFAAAIKRLHTDVAWTFEQPLVLPDRPAGYYHNYFCPDHAVQLEYDPTSPRRHRCPVDGAWFSGEPYDSAWLWSVNHDLSEAAFRLALLWQLEGTAQHRDQAAAILLGYAERYADYRHTDDRPLQGKVAFSPLDESVWVIPMAWAAWFLRDALSASDVATIRDRLLIPAAEHLTGQRRNHIHNIENWLNAAIGTIGIVADRPDLTDLALNGPFGFRRQLADGVRADGVWFEGTASYHFYALAPMLWHARASEHTETDLRHTPQLEAMLSAPLQWAYPDLTLPALNDCWYHSSLLDECGHGMPSAAGFYEVGAGWYQEPAFGGLLRRIYQQQPRDTVEALLYGPEVLPSDEMPTPASVDVAPSGYAVLRNWGSRGATSPPYVLLKYGPHGGGHGHPDKLTILLYANGQRYSPDLGTPGYGIGLNDTWYRHTLSHNTVLLDQTPQPPGRGQLRAFRRPEDGPFGLADAEVRWAEDGSYAGACLRRVLLVGQGYFLDLFLVEAPQAGEIDWVHHNRGELACSLPLQPATSSGATAAGYAHLTAIRQWSGTADASLTFAADDGGLRLDLAPGAATQLMAAQGPFNPASETIPVVIRRRHTQSTCYASVFHPYAGQPLVERVTWFPATSAALPPAGCLVQHRDRRDLWLLTDDADAHWPGGQRPAADHIFTYPVGLSGKH